MAKRTSQAANEDGGRRVRPRADPSPSDSDSGSISESYVEEWADDYYKSEDNDETFTESGNLPPIATATVPLPPIPVARVPAGDTTILDLDASITLCAEQKDAIEKIIEGQNVFITGSAGCGKSTVIKTVVKHFRDQGKKVYITAPTGRSALEIGGMTMWSFASWTPDSMKRTIAQLKATAYQKHLRERLKGAHVLIIDEISMVENWFLCRLDVLLREAREFDFPFGGLQVIVVGDFCQLPPVKPFRFCITCGKEMHVIKRDTEYRCPTPGHGVSLNRDKWAFCAPVWKEAKFHNVLLKSIHRQIDPLLVQILEKIRYGIVLSSAEQDVLENHDSEVDDGVQLCAKKEVARTINGEAFRELRAQARKYYCVDEFVHNPAHTHLLYKGKRSANNTILALDNDHPYEAVLRLKKGMRVVLTQNISIAKGLVNGAQGTIVGFISHEDAVMKAQKSMDDRPAYGTNDNRERLANKEIPLVGSDHIFLRREQINEFLSDRRNKHKYYPQVRFDNAPMVRTQAEKETIFPNCTVESLADDEPYSLLLRTQIPLIQANAMTIHKSQGMTLDKVTVECDGIWEAGQMYTAISRARDLKGLQLQGYSENDRISPSKDVIRFLRTTFPNQIPNV